MCGLTAASEFLHLLLFSALSFPAFNLNYILYNFFNILKNIYFWLRWVIVAAHGAFSSCGERGLLFIAVCRLVIAVASLVAEHGL